MDQRTRSLVDVETRFLAKTEVLASRCWRWTANTNGRYGTFKVQGVRHLAHRWSYQHWVGVIPEGLQIDHFRYPEDGCIGPLCVNPEHLKPATPRENTMRSSAASALNARKTHCPQGHPYSGDNLRIKRSGSRVCRTCNRAAMLTRYYKRKASNA